MEFSEVLPMEKIERQAKIKQFEREKFKADLEFSHKPWWIQQREEGDYKYNNWDMERDDERDRDMESEVLDQGGANQTLPSTRGH